MNLLKDKFGKIPNLWLGAHDELNTTGGKGRTFVWSPTGKKMTYSNWRGVNPNNALFKEHCVHINQNFKWNDAFCDNKIGFICECLSKKCMKLAKC